MSFFVLLFHLINTGDFKKLIIFRNFAGDMARIDQETVQRILDAADIVDVVSDFVKLRRSGANYKGLCPFHNERTPSFSVNKARNICKCFSCGKGGSPVNFIMEHEQMSYQEALRYLARKYNIEIKERELSDEERAQQSKREALLAVNAFALKHFEHNLHDTADGQNIAMAYFRHRGMSDAMVERFHLGYALDRGNDLLTAAKEAGFRDEYLIETGLEVRSDRDGSLYDRYRGRVIFPIHTLSGRVVGFGGRTMRSDKNIAKYVNSPESDIYHKKVELYGLYQARAAIGRRDKCIMVEGYFDVISMHQAGVENVVASSGTSLTVEQIRVIHRFTENITLIYDADAAGIHASLRGINLLLGEKMNVKVLALPPGDDPDSFAQTHSASEVEKYLAEHEVDIIAFMTEKLMADVPAGDPTAKAKVINEILQSVAYVDEPVKRQEYISQCSRMLDVPEDVLINQLNIFITRRYEEADKAARREQARASLGDAPDEPEGETKQEAAAGTTDEVSTDAPLINLDNNALRPYEEMLLRYVVRYGLLYIFDMSTPEGDVIPATVYDIIISELAVDNFVFSHNPFAAVMDAFGHIRNEQWPADREAKLKEIDLECQRMLEEKREEVRRKGSSLMEIEKFEMQAQAEIESFRKKAADEFDMSYGQNKLINSADNTVRTVASELVVERYTLSKIYTHGAHVESEQEQLQTLVPRAINELRSAIVSGMIKELTTKLINLPPDDVDSAAAIMEQLLTWKDYQKQLGKMLGERIILPRQSF